jgi:polygalacturonase
MRLVIFGSLLSWIGMIGCVESTERFSITDYDAVGDGKTINTTSIQKAIDACSETGGGRVFFPPGEYLSGTVILKDHVVLHIGEGATLLGSTDLGDYPEIESPIPHYGRDWVKLSLIYGENLIGAGITGRGTIDGQGAAFKVTTKEKPDRYRNRPYIIRMIGCKDLLIRDIRMQNSAMWMQHYLACDGLIIDGIRVYNHCNQNNDMIDIDGCRDVIISNCSGDTDDDALTFKSLSPNPCENIVVSNCVLSSHCNAIKCGTESTGGFKNFTITNCVIKPSADTTPIFGLPGGTSGISLEVVDGGIMDGIAISNISMDGPEVPLFIRLGNRARKHIPGAPDPGVGSLKNITINNVIAKNTGKTGCSITGIPGHPVQNVRLSNLILEFPGGVVYPASPSDVPELEDHYPEGTMFGELPSYGFYIRHAGNISITDSRAWCLHNDARPALYSEDVDGLNLSGWEAGKY